MKIAITTVQIPFVSGGAEALAAGLKKALIKAGHEAEIVSMPFMDQPAHLLEEYIVASRLMDINNSWAGHIDLCIGLKFPAYYIPHDNKVIWALHQHRQAYELYDTDFSPIKNDIEGRHIRSIVENADNRYLPEAKRIYTISGNVSERMSRFNNLESTPLYHPCPDMESFYPGDYEDYILMPSRINITKRQELAIEALSKTKSDIKLYIVGRADNSAVKGHLINVIKQYGMQERVRLFDFVPHEEKLKLYSRARAVLFIPVDEDLGYITIEGMASSKAVITCSDSGGPLEFVDNGITGLVAQPDAESIAQAIDELALSKHLAVEMGTRANIRLKAMDITWEHVVKELTR